MNKGDASAVAFVALLQKRLKNSKVEVVLAPPFTVLNAMHGELEQGGAIKLAGQNLYWQEAGAFTGEISGKMLKEAGCDYVILGHSERRQLFNEDDASVNKRVHSALAAGLKPIVCVGETLAQRDSGATQAVVEEQLSGSLSGLDATALDRILIAYEPVWAIGTGKNASPDQAQQIHRLIREWLLQRFGSNASTSILYGGSVNPGNSRSILSQDDIDGALVGGASLDIDSFCDIIDSAS